MHLFHIKSKNDRASTPERTLICAIIEDAFYHDLGYMNKNNRDFMFYCNLLGFDPDYLIKAAQEIRSGKRRLSTKQGTTKLVRHVVH